MFGFNWVLFLPGWKRNTQKAQKLTTLEGFMKGAAKYGVMKDA